MALSFLVGCWESAAHGCEPGYVAECEVAPPVCHVRPAPAPWFEGRVCQLRGRCSVDAHSLGPQPRSSSSTERCCGRVSAGNHYLVVLSAGSHDLVAWPPALDSEQYCPVCDPPRSTLWCNITFRSTVVRSTTFHSSAAGSQYMPQRVDCHFASYLQHSTHMCKTC